MEAAELNHLELLAEVDSLLSELDAWSRRAPDWPPARTCGALVQRLSQRAESLRLRLEAPLIVATLGGTGTGKSTLVNALVGQEVTQPGRERPTTKRPVLICRPHLTPELLGIDPASVDVVHVESATLGDLVLIDCPDPDTSEGESGAEGNLERLRRILPQCDVLLVTATQQKYRSAKVAAELAAAATGARLVFVQTHADADADVRDDWRRQLSAEYALGEVFFVDSLTALADARAGSPPRGDFARLVDLLTRELAGAAHLRIRRANFLDLVEQTLSLCQRRLADALPPLEKLEGAIAQQRSRLANKLSSAMRDELLASRRQWDTRLLGEVVAQWGFSPFSLVLRLFLGLGGLLSSAALWRARTPAQLALWGVFEGGRTLQRKRAQRHADAAGNRAVAWSWDETELRKAAIEIDGYAAEAGLPRGEARLESVARQAAAASETFIARTAGDLQSLLGRLAQRHVGWWTRWRYELALGALLALLLYRLGRNFFFDSWLAAELGFTRQPAPVLGLDFLVSAGFWLLLWCVLLVWAFSTRLRRGLNAELQQLADQWSAVPAAELFAGLEARCQAIRRHVDDGQRLHERVTSLRERLARPIARLGHRVA